MTPMPNMAHIMNKDWSVSLAVSPEVRSGTTLGRFFFLSLENTMADMAGMARIGQMFSIFLMFALVCGMAWFTIRLMARARYGRGGGRSNLELLESIAVSQQTYVSIIRAGEKYLLVGITRGQVNLLAELDAEQLQLPAGGSAIRTSLPFEAMLKKFLNRNNEEETRAEGEENSETHTP